MTANSVAVLAACGLLLAAGSAGAQGANPASDAPEHRSRAIECIDAPRSYEEALLRWRAAEDINAWIGAQFDYDMARALRLSEAQRGAQEYARYRGREAKQIRTGAPDVGPLLIVDR